MAITYLEGTCPKCGEKTKEPSNTWAYGSPIRFCPRCKQEYLDARWREVAITGFDPRGSKPGYYFKVFLGTLIVTALSGGWLYYTTHYKGYYSTLTISVFVVCAIATVGSLLLSLWIALGFAAKSNAKYLAESERRLQNPAYVKRLQEYGYVIPAKYLAQAMTDQTAGE